MLRKSLQDLKKKQKLSVSKVVRKAGKKFKTYEGTYVNDDYAYVLKKSTLKEVFQNHYSRLSNIFSEFREQAIFRKQAKDLYTCLPLEAAENLLQAIEC